MKRKDFIPEEHVKLRGVFRKTGPLVVGIGVIMMIIAFVDFFTLDMFEEPKYFWMFFVGIPLVAIGSFLSSLGYGADIARYRTREMAPVVKDTFNYLANETKEGVEAIADALQKGKSKVIEAKECSYCHELNKMDAKFCNECGRKL